MSRMRIALLTAMIITTGFAEAQFTLRAHARPSAQVVDLTWSPVAGATAYTIRRADVYPNWLFNINIGNVTTTTTPMIANYAAVFQITALNAQSQQIAASNLALVTTYSYAQPIVAGTTRSAASHVTELRTVINSARAAAGLGPYSWTRPTLASGARIEVADVQDLRTALAAAWTALGLSTPAWIDPALGTSIRLKKDHIDQLRSRVRNFPELVTATASVSERYFSPNGNGVRDTTVLSASLDRIYSTRWTLNVRNGSGAIVRTASGTGNGVVYSWDGRNTGGAIQPDGDYVFEVLDSEDAAYVAASALTTLDNTMPVAAIASPAAGFVISNVRQNGAGDLAVTGTATDTNLANWTLESNQNQFIGGISSGTTNMPATSSLGTWHTITASSMMGNGAWFLVLSVTDRAANTTIATLNVNVSHFSASQNVYQINSVAGESVTYSSVVPFALSETINIRNAAGQTVRSISAQRAGAGTFNDAWDGKNDQGAFLPDGAYRYTATVTEGSSSMTWDVGAQFVGGGKSQLPYHQCMTATGAWTACDNTSEPFLFDPYFNKPLRIRYCVGGGNPPNCTGSAPAYVMVKVANTAETSMSCATDCIMADYQPSGAQELAWFGTSTSGAFVAEMPRIVVIRATDMIAKNMVIVYGSRPTLTNLVIDPLMFSPASPAGTQQFRLNVSGVPSRTITLKAEFRNLSSGSILRTITNAPAAQGDLVISWDGRAENGVFVAPGTYEVTLTATDSVGSSTKLRPLTVVRY